MRVSFPTLYTTCYTKWLRAKSNGKIFVFAILAFSSSSYAQSALEEIAVIATRIEQAVTELPSNITVLDSQLLESTSAVHIQQLLSQVPGVALQRGNGQESLPSIRSAVLTGAGACGNVLVMEEGIPVRGAGFCNVNELFDTHFEQAARIEVVRGAGSVFYGSNAVVGSVNVVLPVDAKDRLSMEFGSFDYLRAKAAVGYGKEGAKGRFFVTLSDDGGYRDDAGYQQQKISWRHSSELHSWVVNAGASYLNLDQETAGFIVGVNSYRDTVLAQQNLDPEAFRKSESLRAWLKLNRQIGEKQLNVNSYVRHTEMDFLQHFLPGDPLEQNQQTGFGWQSSLTTQASDSLSWAIGFDGDLSQGELVQSQDAATQGSAFLRATIPAGVHYDYQVDATQLAIFGHLNWQFTEHWRLISGLRAEKVGYDYDNRGRDGRTRDDGSECGFGGCRYSRPADSKDDFEHISPKLELQYTPSQAWRFSLSFADSFRAPQATELYRLQRAQTVADLDTSKASSIELGAEYRSESFKFDLSIYQLNQRNLIIRDSDFFNIDGAKTDSTGAELSLFARFNPHWSFKLVASVADHKYASDQISGGLNINGNQLDTAPKFFGNGSVTWSPSDALSIQMQLDHTAGYYLDPENAHEYPGHTLLNLNARYRFDEHWAVSARFLNISDKRYAKRADFTSFTGERYFPGEPRSVFAELSYEF